MSALPHWLMHHEVTAEPYKGEGAYGVVYGPPVPLRCYLEQETRLVRDASGNEVTSGSTLFARLDQVALPPQSRVTLPGGRMTTVIAALRRDGGGLPTPDHLEVQLV